MAPTRTDERPLSKYLAEMRVRLARPERKEKALPQTVFARKVGPGRSPSSINKIEHGTVRPTDDFLAEIASAYPQVADLKQMIRFRDKQFGSEAEWSDRRHTVKAIKPVIPAKAAAERPKASAPSTARAENSGAAESTAVVEPKSGRPGSIREHLTSKVAAPFGARPQAPAAKRPVQATPPATPASDTRSDTRTVETNPGGSSHPRLAAEMLPLFHSLSSTLAPTSGLRLVSAGAIMADRLRRAYGGKGLARMDMRAAARSFVADLYSVLAGEIELSDEEIAKEVAELRTVIGHSEDRSRELQDLTEVLRHILGPVVEDPHLIDLVVLRSLVLGAQR